MEVSDAKQPRGLEFENAKLKRLLAEIVLKRTGLEDVLAKEG